METITLKEESKKQKPEKKLTKKEEAERKKQELKQKQKEAEEQKKLEAQRKKQEKEEKKLEAQRKKQELKDAEELKQKEEAELAPQEQETPAEEPSLEEEKIDSALVLETATPTEDPFKNIKDDWLSESAGVVEETKTKDNAVKKAELQLNKLLSKYNSRLNRLVLETKKIVVVEKKEIEQKSLQLRKMKDTLLSKAQKLELAEQVLKEKTEAVGSIAEKEELFKKNKENLQKEIENYRKILAELKEDVAKNKSQIDLDKRDFLATQTEVMEGVKKMKAQFEAEKKNFLLRQTDAEANIKKLQALYAKEKEKGDARLAELAKKVEAAQKEFDTVTAKKQDLLNQINNREMEIQEREKKANAKIEHGKKIMSILANNSSRGVSVSTYDESTEDISEEEPATNVVEAPAQQTTVENAGNAIQQKIQACKQLIKEGKYDDSKLFYNEIRDDFGKLEIDDATKKELKHEIRELYDEICISMMAPKK
jgi:hypothetical protein